MNDPYAILPTPAEQQRVWNEIRSQNPELPQWKRRIKKFKRRMQGRWLSAIAWSMVVAVSAALILWGAS